MHANEALLDRFFAAYGRLDHEAMASCYHRDAHFRDIAFDIKGRDRIHDMWRMICSGDIEIEYEVIEADDRAGRARLVDTYTFDARERPPGRRVVNPITSRFTFENGLIRNQEDDCDPKEWARQAMGGFRGFLAGRFRFLRSRGARAKVDEFVGANPG